MNGVGAGEWVAIVFDLQGSASYSDVPSQFGDGTVRAGVHVIGFASGGSESFVSTPVPEPSAALLLFSGVGAVAALRRMR